MNTLIQFFGLKRSGNHAVIPWLQLNAFGEDRSVIFHNALYNPNKEYPRVTLPKHVSQPYAKNEGMILSYEDVSLDRLDDIPTWTHSKDILPNAEIKTVLLLREPRNLLASRIKRLENKMQRGDTLQNHKSWEEVIALWKTYAREYLGITHRFNDHIIPISFDRWFSNKHYRNDLLRAQFGITHNLDHGINSVMNNANGSSFDGTTYEGRAHTMDVLNRWRAYEGQPFFQQLTSDPEVQSLSANIFDSARDTKESSISTRHPSRR